MSILESRVKLQIQVKYSIIRAIMISNVKEIITPEIFIQRLDILAQGYLGIQGFDPYKDFDGRVAVPLPRNKKGTGSKLMDDLLQTNLFMSNISVRGLIYPEKGPIRYELNLKEEFEEVETGVELGVYDPEKEKYSHSDFVFKAGTTGHPAYVLHEQPLEKGLVFLSIHKAYHGGEHGPHGDIGCIHVLKNGSFGLHAATISGHTYYSVLEDINFKPWSDSVWHVTNALISGQKPTEPLKTNGKSMSFQFIDDNLLQTFIKIRIKSSGSRPNESLMKFQIPIQIDSEKVLQSVNDLTNPANDLIIDRT